MSSTVSRRAFVATLAAVGAAAYGHAVQAAGAAQGASAVPPDLMTDLVAGNHILVRKGVVEINGHLSARHPANPNRFLLARAIAPETVTAADIMEFDLDSNAIDARAAAVYRKVDSRRDLPGASRRDGRRPCAHRIGASLRDQ